MVKVAVWDSSTVKCQMIARERRRPNFFGVVLGRRGHERDSRTIKFFNPHPGFRLLCTFQILYGAYVRPLLEYTNPVVYSGRTKDVILIEPVQRAATKMVAGLKSMDYETRLAVLDLYPLEYRRLRGDLILTYVLFEQGLANRFFTVGMSSSLHLEKSAQKAFAVLRMIRRTFPRITRTDFQILCAP
ncbi:hypothetical protein CLF_111214 [Clonorchis sinensis]|uniref:Pol-related protein n=1 Tax=Clonorchis sinensis TaxID=79923 RepID=G7YUI5_CLOSI|nr:hypothetical protein CLF_111214 [Clonorchis sinensis]